MNKKPAGLKIRLPQAGTGEEVARMTKQAANLSTVYYNHARVAAGYLDFRIFFGEQTVSPIGQVSFTELVCVAMTPEFANLLLGLLTQQVATYQKLYGPFRTLPENSEAFRKLVEAAQKQAAGGPPKQ